MARITVEDCLKEIPSRFELVVIAAKRARQIASYTQSSDHSSSTDQYQKHDKPTLIALREIAESSIDFNQLYQNKAEKEKMDMDDMLAKMELIDDKIAEKDALNSTSNVHVKQSGEENAQEDADVDSHDTNDAPELDGASEQGQVEQEAVAEIADAKVTEAEVTEAVAEASEQEVDADVQSDSDSSEENTEENKAT